VYRKGEAGGSGARRMRLDRVTRMGIVDFNLIEPAPFGALEEILCS
jgi:hypothetical protein